MLPEASVTVWRRLSEDITETRGPVHVIIIHYLSLATAGQLTPGPYWHTDQVLAVCTLWCAHILMNYTHREHAQH